MLIRSRIAAIIEVREVIKQLNRIKLWGILIESYNQKHYLFPQIRYQILESLCGPA